MTSYYETPEWRATRERLLLSGRGRKGCGGCGRVTASPDIHHRTYRRIGREHLGDLILLCRECHDWTHHLAALTGDELWRVTGMVVKARSRRKSPYRSPVLR